MSPVEIAKEYIQAAQTGDQSRLAMVVSPNVVWHQPGKNRFSGIHTGIGEVLGMLAGMMEVSCGTFSIPRASRFMANGDLVVIELEFSAQRPGMTLAQPGVDLLRIDNGRIVEVRLFSSDQDAEDAFWGR